MQKNGHQIVKKWNSHFQIAFKNFTADLAWRKFNVPSSPGNEKLKIWQKFWWQIWTWPNLMPPTPYPWKVVDRTKMEYEHEQARDGTCTHDGLGGFYPDGILHCWQLCHKPFGFLVVHNSLWHITNSFVFFLTENSRVSGCLLVQPCLTTGTCECWSIDLSLKIDRN